MLLICSYRNFHQGELIVTGTSAQNGAPFGDLKCDEFLSDGLCRIFHTAYKARF